MILALCALSLTATLLWADTANNPYTHVVTTRFPRWIAAHRGGEFSNFRQGTIPQFLRAIHDGANVLEMDVRLTKDGIAIIHHNASLGKLNSCSGKVSDYTLSELRGRCQMADQALKGEFIPTLEEVLSTVHGDAVVNLEAKTFDSIGPMLQLVAKHHAYNWVYISAYPDFYAAIRQYERQYALSQQIMVEYNPAGSQQLLEEGLRLKDINIIAMQLHPKTLTCKNVRAIHETGLRASANSWPYVGFNERMASGCSEIFRRGIDIARTNNVPSCKVQKVVSQHAAQNDCESG
ncbi:glycerophosphodiester phosphodiesterase family protein [Methylogaea oryzae]|uniref:glycerophosphodiester phosphodiesterase family protein n=1 Tax=Methylogaea oryzae TaxID=1295382 RepID=UPI00138F848A|nr:glycerophosphodiester phosphodiesterase family protein [Methylogaea oryzae]